MLLVHKARQLRYKTGNWALHAKHEEWNASLREMSRKYLVRPFLLMVNPICFLMSFYASFVYGLIYGSLSAIPLVFEEKRGWSPVVGSLPFIALLLGCVLGLFGSTFNSKLYARAVDNNDGKPAPEARLYPMMVGSFSLVAGLFIFGWTGNSDVIWVVPCIGIVLIGGGFYPIFQASLNYVYRPLRLHTKSLANNNTRSLMHLSQLRHQRLPPSHSCVACLLPRSLSLWQVPPLPIFFLYERDLTLMGRNRC